MLQYEPPVFKGGKIDLELHDRFLYDSEGKLLMDPKQADLGYLSLMIGYLPYSDEKKLNTRGSSVY